MTILFWAYVGIGVVTYVVINLNPLPKVPHAPLGTRLVMRSYDLLFSIIWPVFWLLIACAVFLEEEKW